MNAIITRFLSFEDLLMQVFGVNILQDEKIWMKIFRNTFKTITKLGDGFVYPLTIVFIVMNNSVNTQTFVLCFVYAFAIERVIYFSVKNSVKRIRPFEKLKLENVPIIPMDRYSFPSGHTSAAFLFATIITNFFPALTFFMYILAILIGISRIVLNLHYPTDVLIGCLIGIVTGHIGISLTSLI